MWTIEPPHLHVVGVLAGMLAALVAGSVVRIRALHGNAEDIVHSRMASLKTWWVLTVLLSTAIVLGELGVVVLLGIITTLGFREFVRVTQLNVAGQTTIILAYALIATNSLWLLLGWWDVFIVWLPVAGLLVLPTAIVLRGQTHGFLRSAAAITWGLLFIVYLPSHALAFYSMPGDLTAPVGAAGLFIYLLLLTEWNDIAQALVGRRFGQRRITPTVSPRKSLEGLLGGAASTILLAVLLAPWLTPVSNEMVLPRLVWSLLAGAVISLSGFLGDITMSAVKRDAGVKDSGSLLPGQGGILDRIDSLTFTAPVFAYYIKWSLT